MSIRILGGHARGFSIQVPTGNKTRPTSVMLRRRIFDSFQDLSEVQFFDICSGTGAIGLEAISRGAKSVVFCEKDKKAQSILGKNVDNFKNKYPSDVQIKIYKSDFNKCLSLEEVPNDTILFFDPPYDQTALYHKFNELTSGINSSHQLWIESDKQKGLGVQDLEEMFGPADKVFEQGTSFLLVYKRHF